MISFNMMKPGVKNPKNSHPKRKHKQTKEEDDLDFVSKRQKQQPDTPEEFSEEKDGLYIAEDTVENILVRLPVKSLVRLKATCKRWRSLIQSPTFIRLHCRQHSLDHHDRLLVSRKTLGQSDDCLMMYSCAVSADNPPTPLFDMGWLPRVPEFPKWPHPPHSDSDSDSDLDVDDDHDGDDHDDHDGDDDYDDDDDYDARWSSVFITKPPYTSTSTLGPLDNGIYLHVHHDQQRTGHLSVGTSKIALCNPATREYKFLNPFPSSTARMLSTLAEKPSLVSYGFGTIHNETGFVADYKVVVNILYDRDYSCMLSFLYSLRSRGWRKIADVRHGVNKYRRGGNKAGCSVAGLVDETTGAVETPRYLVRAGGIKPSHVFLNGSCHWLDLDVSGTTRRGYDRVLSFDVAREEFRLFHGPKRLVDEVEGEDGSDRNLQINRGLFVLDHHLAMVYMPHYFSLQKRHWCCTGFQVWVMMEYGNGDSWTKIYASKFALDKFYASFIGATCTTNVDDDASGGINLQRIFLHNGYGGRVVSWDGSQVTEHEFHLKQDELAWNTLGVSTYVETLESLNLAHKLIHL